MAMNNLIKSAAPATVLNLLHAIMQDERLDPFYLVGGTSLALRLGHRMSIDIDLFVHENFDVDFVSEILDKRYNATTMEKENNTVRAIIQETKVDLIAHKYPLLEPVIHIDGIRMASLKDIAAMKINAISNRGAKKDFWDMAALLKCFSIEEMLVFFENKYPAVNSWHAEKSLSFFDDAENEPDPKDLSGRSWQEIKQIILQSLRL